MAGAMRLGELAHLMESRMTPGDALAQGSSELFDALDNDLDHIAFLLDRLQKGEVDSALPWVGAGADAAGQATSMAETPMASPATLAAVPALSVAPHAQMPVTTGREAAATDTEARAMLRVRADLIDRLVNEAGEVAIARARAEGELRAAAAAMARGDDAR